MPIVVCAKCNAKLKLPDDREAIAFQCPKCKTTLKVSLLDPSSTLVCRSEESQKIPLSSQDSNRPSSESKSSDVSPVSPPVQETVEESLHVNQNNRTPIKPASQVNRLLRRRPWLVLVAHFFSVAWIAILLPMTVIIGPANVIGIIFSVRTGGLPGLGRDAVDLFDSPMASLFSFFLLLIAHVTPSLVLSLLAELVHYMRLFQKRADHFFYWAVQRESNLSPTEPK